MKNRLFSTSSPGPSPRSKWRAENPWQFVRISSRKHDEISLLCLNNGFRLQKINRAAKRWKQPPKKSHFIMCHVTKYATIRGVFQQPCPGVSPTSILNEEKALGTRLHYFLIESKRELISLYLLRFNSQLDLNISGLPNQFSAETSRWVPLIYDMVQLGHKDYVNTMKVHFGYIVSYIYIYGPVRPHCNVAFTWVKH